MDDSENSQYAQNNDAVIAVMANNIDHIQKDVSNIKETMKGSFVTVDKHNALAERVKLLQSIIFGMIALIVVGFLTAVVNFFINNQQA